MQLPESWGLTTQKRDDGKLDIIGKDDTGNPYKVRTTDGAEVTDTDISELRDADRESYSNRQSGAREFVKKLSESGRAARESRESEFHSDLTEAASEVVSKCTEGGRATRPGMIELPLTMGSTRKYRAGWPKDWEN